jgi:hypothetical protein
LASSDIVSFDYTKHLPQGLTKWLNQITKIYFEIPNEGKMTYVRGSSGQDSAMVVLFPVGGWVQSRYKMEADFAPMVSARYVLERMGEIRRYKDLINASSGLSH